MARRTGELVLGCREPEVLARFRCEVLDFVVLHREGDGCIEIGPREGFGGAQPTIVLSRRDGPGEGGSRLHVDVNPTDRDQGAELERLLGLGARPAGAGQTGQEQWHVLADPEGNQFFLLKARLAPPLPPIGHAPAPGTGPVPGSGAAGAPWPCRGRAPGEARRPGGAWHREGRGRSRHRPAPAPRGRPKDPPGDGRGAPEALSRG